MRKLLFSTSAAVALSAAVAAQAASISFSFDGVAIGAGTPFTLTSGGLTATFSAAGDPGGFQVTPSFFTFPENVLLQPGLSGQDYQALDITFSGTVHSLSGDFATEGPGPLVLTALTGGLGGTVVGSSSAAGAIPAGYLFPEGTISFGGAGFDAVILADAKDPGFALGSFTVSTVPEPSTWAMLGLAFAGLALVGTRGRFGRLPSIS